MLVSFRIVLYYSDPLNTSFNYFHWCPTAGRE
jgi:hypothetical protein